MAVTLQSYSNDQVFSCDIGDYTISGLTASTAYTITISKLFPSTSDILTLNLVSDASGEIILYNLQDVIENHLQKLGVLKGQFCITVGEDDYTFMVYNSMFRRYRDVAEYVSRNFALSNRHYVVPRFGYFRLTLLSVTTLKFKATYLNLDSGETETSEHNLTTTPSSPNFNVSPSRISAILESSDIHHVLYSYSIYSGSHCVTIYVINEQSTHRFLFLNNFFSWQCLNMIAGSKRSLDRQKSEAVCNGKKSYYDVRNSYQLDLEAFVPNYLSGEIDELIHSRDVRLIPDGTDLTGGVIDPDSCTKVLITSHTFDFNDEGTEAQTMNVKLMFADPRDCQTEALPADGIFHSEYDEIYS